LINILLLEDELEFANLIKSGLEDIGYKVTHCTTGREALDLLTTGTFDLMIVDILIKKGAGLVPDGGISVITATRTALPTMTPLGHQSKIPIIAVSGSISISDSPDLLDIATEMGANAVIRKPFSQTKLLAEIRKLTEQSA